MRVPYQPKLITFNLKIIPFLTNNCVSSIILDLNKKVASVGVGGESQGKLILLNNVKIGNYTLSNVVASVSLENNFSLLGTGFLLKFSNVIWNMKKETLILYK